MVAPLFVSTTLADPYAKAVVSATIINLNNGNTRTDPTRALGAPDGIYVSMGGPGASLLLDMGEDTPIVNGPGPDLEITEIGDVVGGVDESYDVFVSNSPERETFVPVGTGRALSLIDIEPSGLASARYVLLQDIATETLGRPTPGSDIDSLRIIHYTGEGAVSPPSGLGQKPTDQGVWLSWTASSDPNVSGYVIRKSPDAFTFSSTPTATVSADETAWHDLTPPGVRNYYYAVSTIANGVESQLITVEVDSSVIPLLSGDPVHLGDNEIPGWEDPTPQPELELTFNLPATPQGPFAELSFDVFDVDYGTQPVLVNGGRIGNVPTATAETWSPKVLRIPTSALQPGLNTVKIFPRNSSGGTTGNLDDFQIRNVSLALFGSPSLITLSTAARIIQVSSDQTRVTIRWVIEQSPDLSSDHWEPVSSPFEWTADIVPDHGFFRLREVP